MVSNGQVERVIRRNSKVLTVGEETKVAWAAQEMKRHGVGCLVVIDESEKVVGILSERDIIAKVVADGLDGSQVSVGEVMTENVISIRPSASISDAQKIMAANHIRHLPILDEGVLAGVISSRDVLEQQLHNVNEIVRKQSRILQDLECEHPGITNLQKDGRGRIVI